MTESESSTKEKSMREILGFWPFVGYMLLMPFGIVWAYWNVWNDNRKEKRDAKRWKAGK